MKTFKIAVLPGDGIGSEIIPPCLKVLDTAARKFGGFALEYDTVEAGADFYRRTGEAFPEAAFKRCEESDAILLAAMGLPEVRYPDGREISPQLDLRERLNLYAGVRPVKMYPGVPPVLADERNRDIDFVLVRESTEGLFSSRTDNLGDGKNEARDILKITRGVSERLFDFSFRLARKRRERGSAGRVTCVDKANVLSSFAFFRGIFDEIAGKYGDIETDYSYVDAMALNMVKRPWEYDVMVTENMFGDILSDLGAGIMGGMGMAPSGDVGDKHAVFQPCHGSAPDIAGQGKANPTAMFLSGALMLDWLADMQDVPQAAEAGVFIERAVEEAFASGELKPYEFGGSDGTEAITAAVLKRMEG